MKRTLLAAVAAFGLLSSAHSQGNDNCKNIKAILLDLPQDLKNFKGHEIMGDTWDPTVALKGYEVTLISNNTFSIDYRAVTAAVKTKDEGASAFKQIVADMKACLTDYLVADVTTPEFMELDFNNKANDKIQVAVTLQEVPDYYQVAVFIRKNKEVK